MKRGVMEYWSKGVLGAWATALLLSDYSITPLLHHSIRR
jgi:hypothetical protein